MKAGDRATLAIGQWIHERAGVRVKERVAALSSAPAVCRHVVTIALSAALVACTGPNEVALEMMLEQFRPPAAFSGAGLDARYEYVRITSNGRPAFMVRGIASALAQQAAAPDSVWYSADREVMFLRGGRIVRTLGIPVELHRVEARFPDWTGLQPGQSASYTRRRDFARPGRYGVTEQIEVTRLASPPKPAQWSANAALPAPQALVWFEERVVQTGPVSSGSRQLPPARFAVDFSAVSGAGSSPGADARVVYSEQCLSENLCLTLQAWPLQANHNARL